MLSQLTIPKKTEQTALNREQLYALGLEYVQRLSREIWTDYNLHDPGITTLELLCYALTDLSYRASFPMADLLASETDNAEVIKQQFFTARQILPSRPLTLLDYRKLLLDIDGVKNAWLLPARRTYYADILKGKLLQENLKRQGIVEVNIAGLYEVKIQYEDKITTVTDKQNVIDKVEQKLQANRNLCEDFVKLTVELTEVQTQFFQLCAEIELTPDANADKVNTTILREVQEYLAPSVRFYSLSEMLARTKTDKTSYTVDKIFEGPTLESGFIDDEELEKADLRRKILLSDIISIIMDIPGVRTVRDIVINPVVINPESNKISLVDKWVIPVELDKQARLNSELSRLVFYKRNMPVIAAKIESIASTVQPVNEINDLEIPLGKYRDLASYYSFQNHFPAIYGLSEVGLSSTADDKRKALAYQLKAYLLFFDQVMANYLAQLSQVKELFSINPDLKQTYFYQVVNSFADYDKIYATNNPINTLQTENNNREASQGFDRRNRFLDHLISRFAERFHDLANTMYSVFAEKPENIIKYKCEFLKHYPTISSDRSLAYNYSLTNHHELWNTDNVSGLEKRLAKLLGIRSYQRRNLGDIAYDIYAEVDENPTDEFRFRIRKRDSLEIILSSRTKYTTPELAKIAMEQAIHFAIMPSMYQRKLASNGKHYFNIINETGQVMARRIEYFNSEVEMNQAIDDLIEYLKINYSDEGMYLIENILLLPTENTDPFLPICPGQNCTDCSELDPYSYRINIILPAYSNRFMNMNFRRFTEEVIRQEVPAHILPKICWINKDEMAELEKLYRDWIYLKAGVQKNDRQKKLGDFIKHLFKIKTVYNVGNLHKCDSPEEQPKFILGQTALGKLK